MGFLLGTIWGVGGFLVALVFNAWDRIACRPPEGTPASDERRGVVFAASFLGLALPLGMAHAAMVGAVVLVPALCALVYTVKTAASAVWCCVLVALAALSVLLGHTVGMAAQWRWDGWGDAFDLIVGGVAVATALPPVIGGVLLGVSRNRRDGISLLSLGIVVAGVMAFAQLAQ